MTSNSTSIPLFALSTQAERDEAEKQKREQMAAGKWAFRAGAALAAGAIFTVFTGGTGGAVLGVLAFFGGGTIAAGGLGAAGGIAVLGLLSAALAGVSAEIARGLTRPSSRQEYLISLNAVLRHIQAENHFLSLISYNHESSHSLVDAVAKHIFPLYPRNTFFLDRHCVHFTLNEILEHVQNSTMVIVVLTPQYLHSWACMRELITALRCKRTLMVVHNNEKQSVDYASLSKLSTSIDLPQVVPQETLDKLKQEEFTEDEILNSLKMLSTVVGIQVREGDVTHSVKEICDKIALTLEGILRHSLEGKGKESS